MTVLFEILGNPDALADAKSACWIELQTMATNSRIWESSIFWRVLDRVFKTSNLTKKDRNDSGISEAIEALRIAVWASNRSNSKRRVAKETKRKLKYLTDILSTTLVSEGRLRARVKALLCEILSPKELYDICFRLWKRDVQEIADNDDYLSRIQLYLPELSNSALMDDKQRDEYYQLLGSDDKIVRRRARDRLNSLQVPN